MIEQPVFLVGAERSGTTMLRLMLDHHPRIAWLNEFEYAVDLVADNGQTPELGNYAKWLRQHRIFKATGFVIDPSLGYQQLVHSFLEQRRESRGKPIIGATVHRHFDRLIDLFPGARFIHLIRDPRDVAPSVIKMGWAGNVYAACTPWVEAERVWDSIEKRIEPDRFVQIRYEELLAHPDRELAKACALMGVEFDEAMLDFHEHTSYQPPDASASQRWKKTLKSREVMLVESRCAEILQRRGYECINEHPSPPSSLGRVWLAIHNKLGRTGARIRRYGFGLWLRSLIARRLSPNGAYPRIKAQMDDVIRRSLQ
ncbi:MAG: sulfotransferase [Phycisphaerales bacterium]|nr:sulfotransferase [Phycisphaerales bacterium]